MKTKLFIFFSIIILLISPLIAQGQQSYTESAEDKSSNTVNEQGQSTNRPKQSTQQIYVTFENGILALRLYADEGMCDILIKTENDVMTYVFDSKNPFETYLEDSTEIQIEIRTARNNIYNINL